MNQPGVLRGVRVLELAHMVAAPVCGTILADFGAHVTKVELKPGGDFVRAFGPRLPDGASAIFASVNRSKHGVVLDPRDAADREDLRALIAESDVLLTNVDAARLKQSGLDPSSLTSSWPRLIYVRVSAFGPEGPPGTDSLAQAATGMTSATGDAEGEGVRVGPPVVDVATGVWAALAVMVALEHRRQHGTGQLVDLSLEDVSLHLQTTFLAMAAADPGSVSRQGNHSPIVCTPVFRTSTDRIFVSLVSERHWQSFAALFPSNRLLDDSRFASNSLRQRHQRELQLALGELFIRRPAEDWTSELSAHAIPNAVERSYLSVLGDERHHALGTLFSLPTRAGYESLQVAPPARFSAVDGPRVPPFAGPGALGVLRTRHGEDKR